MTFNKLIKELQMSIKEEFRGYPKAVKVMAIATVLGILTIFASCVLNVYEVLNGETVMGIIMVIIPATLIVNAIAFLNGGWCYDWDVF